MRCGVSEPAREVLAEAQLEAEPPAPVVLRRHANQRRRERPQQGRHRLGRRARPRLAVPGVVGEGHPHLYRASLLRLRERVARAGEGQEEKLGALGLMLNVIAFWNAIYIQAVVENLQAPGHVIDPADLARISPLVHRHINFLGRYAFTIPEAVARGELRPLREPDSE